MVAVSFPKDAICETCKENKAVFFGFNDENWKFVCGCVNLAEEAHVEIEEFFKTPTATVDTMAHLNEKIWMNWSSFGAMMERFRDATESYGT